jgi:uncharacterized damage-inducible protein DinB
MNNEMYTDYTNTISQLEEVITSIDQEKLNIAPFEGSWTAAQVVEHVIKSQAMATDLIYGDTKNTDRDPYEKVEEIKKVFLDFTIKMSSPEVILPSDKVQDKQKLLTNLETVSSKIKNAIQTLKLDEVCTAFSLPNTGALTRGEWIYFIIYHTQRHIHQLKNIIENIN